MKARPSQPLQIILAGAIALSAGGAFGQAVPAPSAPPAVLVTSASGGDLKHAERAGDQFGAFAGSRENTEALALALRNGSEVTLLGTEGTATTFTPATGHMGHGNVTKSMALAQRQLAAIGISNPTPQQVEAALNGGPVTVGSGADARTVEMQGILRLRADGMGWGKIAHTVGVKPGQGFRPTYVPPADGIVTPYGDAQRVRVEERVGGRGQVADGSGNALTTRSEIRSRAETRGVTTAQGDLHRTRTEERVRTRERTVDAGGNQIRTRSELRTRTEARGVVTAAGGAPVSGTEVRGHKGGGTEIAHRHGGRALGSGIVTAAGAPAVGGQATRGAEARIQRGGGGEAVHGGGRHAASGSGVVSAAGNTVAMNGGARSSGGNGGGNGRGGGGKR
ncbi:MAG TPA: hypothetical protein VFP70_01640 [Burkholderiales bacterium]|nr:hypothetical protein [Burkholderiales bacterium]